MSEPQYILLEYENMPCFWQISFDVANTAIVVKIHEDFVQFLPSLQEHSLLKEFANDFPFTTFAHDWRGESFGFEGCFKRAPMDGPFIVFSVPIPVLEKFQMQACAYCRGYENSTLIGGTCLSCNDTREEKKMKPCTWCETSSKPEDCIWCKGSRLIPDSWMDWQQFYAISATFSVFLTLASFGQEVDKFVASREPQLLFLQTTTVSGACPVYGTYSKPLVKWLKKFLPRLEIWEATDAMTAVWKKIHGGRFSDTDKLDTWAHVLENGWLNINCPGDRTGLHPVRRSLGQDDGYQFSSHNVDDPKQQLTLLACLGALCDKARKEIT